MPTTTTPTLTPEELAAKKAAIAQQQTADTNAVIESEAALHRLADKLHNAAFAAGKTPLPSYADSLKAAATDIIAKAGKDFPSAALANLQRYAPGAQPATAAPQADPITTAEQAAETADAA